MKIEHDFYDIDIDSVELGMRLIDVNLSSGLIIQFNTVDIIALAKAIGITVEDLC